MTRLKEGGGGGEGNTKALALHYRIFTVLSKLTTKYSFREES